MRIVSVCHYYPPHVGGLEGVARDTAESLSRAGHEVTVLTSALAGASHSSQEGSVRIQRLPALNVLDRWFSLPFPILGIRSVILMWRAISHAHVVHIHDVFYMTSWIALMCAQLKGTRMILTQHVGIVDHPNPIVMLIQRIVYATWGAWIFRSAHGIIVYNAIVKNFLTNRGVPALKIFEFKHGVDLNVFHPVSDQQKKELRTQFGLSNKPIALFVGRLVPKKGIQQLCAARNSLYDIVVVGSGTIDPEWKREGIHFLGSLTGQRLVDAYRMADVCVIPSQRELFTLVMQEALAVGLPVITTDEPEYAEYHLDTRGVMFVPRTGEALASAITRVIEDDTLAAHMRDYSRELARGLFDRERNTSQIVSFFERFEPKIYVTTSWDDGHVLDSKLAALLRKYGITGTMYISPQDRELSEEMRLSREGVIALSCDLEIGAHTVTHPFLPDIDDETARREIVGSKEILEAWIGKPVTSFCYPKGGYLPVHAEMVKDAGFARARTVERFACSPGSDPFVTPTTIHTYDHWSDLWDVLKLARFNPIRFLRLYRRWDRQAKALFDAVSARGGVFHLWGHSWEVDNHGDWTRLEDVLKYIAHKKGVQYVANDAVV